MSDGLRKYFEKRLTKPDKNGCIEWHTDKVPMKGTYAQFQMRASRFSYMLYKGYVEKEKIMLHSCDNPACVNPDHIRPGTHKENTREMDERSRRLRRKKIFKLNHADILAIRRKILKGTQIIKLAEKYNISIEIIESIRDGKEWNNKKEQSK